jgi:hypothetical protein
MTIPEVSLLFLELPVTNPSLLLLNFPRGLIQENVIALRGQPS